MLLWLLSSADRAEQLPLGQWLRARFQLCANVRSADALAARQSQIIQTEFSGELFFCV